MAIAPIKRFAQTSRPLDAACAALTACARDMSGHHRALSRPEGLQFVVDVERASRVLDHLQIIAARVAEEHYAEPAPRGIASSDTGATSSATGGMALDGRTAGGPRDCAEFLRGALGISRTEARRRLALAQLVLPGMSPTGAALPPRLESLGAAMDACLISGRAATIVSQAVQRVHSSATPDQAESMERHLTRQAVESDEDILRVLARRWEGVLDQDGQEPTDTVLRARQGVFLKGRRHGLHILEIGATEEQFEHLATVMNATANPRTSSSRTGAAANPRTSSSRTGAAGSPGAADGAGRHGTARTAGTGSATGTESGSGTASGADLFTDPGVVTRAQALLEGLVAACRIALSSAALPATGSLRPQVMVTIDYKDLTGATHRPGHAVFAEQASARTIRKLACDADIIPVVLGGAGQILDVGRARRLFPPHLRRALVARDKGCAFPDCTIPGSWCEAHHIKPWSRGGTTSIGNGVLLCSRHHHLIHQGTWTVEPRHGIPWFHAPGLPGRAGTTRTNTYWQTGRIVRGELPHDTPFHDTPFHDQPGPGPTSPDRDAPEQTGPGHDRPKQTGPG